LPVHPLLTIASDRIEVTVLPDKGADICSLVDKRSGIDFLFKSPWRGRTGAHYGSSSMERWIEAYPGGWQVLLPNGGDECTEQGVTWGYHGEAAVVPWEVISASARSAVLETQLMTVPLSVRRLVEVEGPVLRLTETVTNGSGEQVEAMWSHHPAFGPPFLEGGCTISAGCRSLVADDRSPGTLLSPGSRHAWPYAGTVDGGQVDMRQVPPPGQQRAVLAYLEDFSEGFFALTNSRIGLGIGFRWPLDPFPKAWLWQEVHSGKGWPWYQRAYVVAVEPASTIPGQGMASARSHGQKGAIFGAHASREVVIEAVVFDGAGEVASIGEGGTVRFA